MSTKEERRARRAERRARRKAEGKSFFDTGVGQVIKGAATLLPGVGPIIRQLDGVGSFGEAIDLVRESTEGTQEERYRLEELLLDHQSKFEKAISDRWVADAQSDSWWSKNIRPLTFAFITILVAALVVIDSNEHLDFAVNAEWVDLYKWAYITYIGGYIGGRSFDKLTRLKHGK